MGFVHTKKRAIHRKWFIDDKFVKGEEEEDLNDSDEDNEDFCVDDEEKNENAYAINKEWVKYYKKYFNDKNQLHKDLRNNINESSNNANKSSNNENDSLNDVNDSSNNANKTPKNRGLGYYMLGTLEWLNNPDISYLIWKKVLKIFFGILIIINLLLQNIIGKREL